MRDAANLELVVEDDGEGDEDDEDEGDEWGVLLLPAPAPSLEDCGYAHGEMMWEGGSSTKVKS